MRREVLNGKLHWLAALTAIGIGCQEAPVRPQLVLYLDIDLPVGSQASEQISPDAIVDSLRVEIYAADNTLINARVFSIASEVSLPLAFGIRSDAVAEAEVRVRVRAFRAELAKNGSLGGEPIFDPRVEVSIDRLVSLSLPAEGVAERTVVLRGDCIGKPIRFGIGGQPDRTCIDGSELDGLAKDGVVEGVPNETVSGSWPHAAVRACGPDAPPGAVCIPGGFFVLGDPLFIARHEFEHDALPLRPVLLSPFFMDVHEVTVGELRVLLKEGYDGPLPAPKQPESESDRHCTWDPESDAALPLNCIRVEVAEAICSARGGSLPSEAQWDYAARGRGLRHVFVWGSDTPACCSANIGYFPGGGCSPEGPEPFGSHLGSLGCSGDLSRDEVLDLNGSVSELVADAIANFSDDCWAAQTESAILENPICSGATGHMARGAAWDFTVGDAPLPVRRQFLELDTSYGFRCVYEAPE